MDRGMEKALRRLRGQGVVLQQPPSWLLKNDGSPSGRDGQVRGKDAGSANSGAICATEDTLSRRPFRWPELRSSAAS
jgi:hypothetical protein